MSDRDAIEDILIDHTRIRGISGDCSCGITVGLGLSFAAHQADAILDSGFSRGTRTVTIFHGGDE